MNREVLKKKKKQLNSVTTGVPVSLIFNHKNLRELVVKAVDYVKLFKATNVFSYRLDVRKCLEGESVKYFLDNLHKLGEPWQYSDCSCCIFSPSTVQISAISLQNALYSRNPLFLENCQVQVNALAMVVATVVVVDTVGTARLDYIPSQQDILLARRPTKGIHEYDFEIKNVPFKMVDVGGQRSERKRWFECFDSVTSILFLVSSSEFDQVLMEDRLTNRLTESLNIFETIVNNREKVQIVSIKDYFVDFEGDPHCLRDVQKFLVECFRNKRRDQQQKPLYHHFTTAINTENIRLVFRDVKDTILHDNLKQLMLHFMEFHHHYICGNLQWRHAFVIHERYRHVAPHRNASVHSIVQLHWRLSYIVKICWLISQELSTLSDIVMEWWTSSKGVPRHLVRFDMGMGKGEPLIFLSAPLKLAEASRGCFRAHVIGGGGTFSNSKGLLSKDVLIIVYKSQLKTICERRPERALGYQTAGFFTSEYCIHQ
ncbi:hypothetical protein HPG69_018803 [Diceros bicornis minor]|uniref:Uncharacterized protein n=1 Tax=Diceros bicornis minor TaxID=77932 RepID=A0A7J7F8K6_DICBM|nr:hypothetical protein HPG69_018803 [Diceros bicornis minor]